MAYLQGFWSYVHADDEADHGRISQLARDVVSQYEMITGEKISLFLDKDAIEWGEKWRDKIDTSLASVGFFVPVLTPRYFMSAECRRELQFFARKAVDLGVEELILPLVYLDIPSLNDKTPTDDLMLFARQFQWEDWQDLRFLDVDSEKYRRGVFKLAKRIVEANRRAEEQVPLKVITPKEIEDRSAENKKEYLLIETDSATESEELGTLDILAEAEEKLNLSPNTLDEIAQEILKIGDIMRQATADIQKPSNAKSSFALRQVISRRTANQLKEPTERIWLLSNELSSQTHSIDLGFRIIIERANEEIKDDPNSKEHFCNFFKSVRHMSASAGEAFESVQTMINATDPLDKMSRDLRPVTRQLRQGLTVMVELKGIYQEWVDLIDATGISCETGDILINAQS